ncbi:MAG: hypothetical protein ABI840_09760 [bacterium]
MFQSAEKKEQKLVEKELRDTLKMLWKYDSVEKHYIEDKKFFFQALSVPTNKYTKFLMTKDTSYLTKLLGRKYMVSKDNSTQTSANKRLTYWFSPYPCTDAEKTRERCKSLDFYFDDRDMSRIKTINFNFDLPPQGKFY